MDALEIYVWEGSADIAVCVKRCMASLDVQVTRADGVVFSAVRNICKSAIAVIGVSPLEGVQLTRQSIEGSYGMPVIWVAASGREGDEGSLQIRTDARLVAATRRAGETAEYHFDTARRGYLVPAKGRVEVNGVQAKARDGVAIEQEPVLRVTALEDSEIVLVDVA